MKLTRLSLLLAICVTATAAFAQKKRLDETVYDNWKSLSGSRLSNDGKWLMFRVVPQEGDGILYVRSTDGGATFTIERGSAASFTPDNRALVSTVIPKFVESRDARRKKAKPEDMPKNALVVMSLPDGKVQTIDRVTSFTMPDKGGDWFAYRPEPPKPAEPDKKADDKKPEEKKGEAKKTDEKPKKKADHKPGTDLILRNAVTGQERKVPDVVAFKFSEDGRALAYTVSTKDGSGDGVVWMDVESGKTVPVMTQLGRYPAFAFDKNASILAFVTDKDDYAADKPSHAVYVFDSKTGKSELVAKEGSPGMVPGWYVPANSSLRVSDSGKRIFFSTVLKPAPEKKDETPDDEKVSVDVWSWTDGILQPQQLLQATAEKNRTYDAVYLRDSGTIRQLETPEMKTVQIDRTGDLPYAIGIGDGTYDREASWDTGYSDYYLVDLQQGQVRQIGTKVEGNYALSPNGKYVYAADNGKQQITIIDASSGHAVDVTHAIPNRLFDEQNDVPGNANPYGVAGWTKDDARLLIYDADDIWSVDPTGSTAPVNVTHGLGRASDVTFRNLDLDPERTYLDGQTPTLLSAFNNRTKAAGFYRARLDGAEIPKQVVMEEKAFGTPAKARDASTIVYTRMDFDEYPDAWVADGVDFAHPRKLSDTNPQQADYNWGKTELISWMSNDGVPLQGFVIKPDDFDYGKKYPMIVYFYERNSDTLHAYRSPSPTASILNPTMAVSNDYIVFIPDIVYKEGYPGESAISCILPGVQEVLKRGYVDPKKMAIDGQSWGGYQVAYMITETDMFACAYAGAPVSDMFSAYGGIRWGSGLVREFQYEKGQSRIGESLWQAPLRYLENSPVFFLDKVKTPVLIMSNDKDGSVPWYQGIEMFTGLRRLQKPAWLLVYNGEDHNLVERKNRKDLSIRKQQFYDYYLKGAPMPEWMKGVPAVNKGKDYGLSLSRS